MYPLSFILSENSWKALKFTVFSSWLFMKSSDQMSIRYLVSSSPHVLSWLILFWCLVLPLFSSWSSDVSLLWLPVIGPKVPTFQNNYLTPASNQTMVQFDPDWDHLLQLDQGPAVWSGQGFTSVFLVPIKLKSLKVRTSEGGVKAL